MDTFFTKMRCDRCGGPLDNGRIMSMFNTDCICMKCKKEERKRNDYDRARETEMSAVRGGDYNFSGISLS